MRKLRMDKLLDVHFHGCMGIDVTTANRCTAGLYALSASTLLWFAWAWMRVWGAGTSQVMSDFGAVL